MAKQRPTDQVRTEKLADATTPMADKVEKERPKDVIRTESLEHADIRDDE